MEIEYYISQHSFYIDPPVESYTDDIGYWIESNLKKGGIEQQIKKLQALFSVVGAKFLMDNPDEVGAVACAIECEGKLHRIKNNGLDNT